ncbi:MAG: hypothetical protein ACTSXA_15210 [Candidatus Heimdallarchaeota archaeon]
MTIKVKDMTTEELRKLITKSVSEAVEDLLEDILGLSGDSYLESIEEARTDYKEGRFIKLEDLL